MIQARYGWTDSELGQIRLKDYDIKLKIVIEKSIRSERVKRSHAMTSAYMAWHNGMVMGKGEKINFHMFLNRLGLLDKENMNLKRVTKEEALAKAARIVKMDQKRKK